MNKIIIHCSATQNKSNIDVDTIREWHLQRGWSDVGYHMIITTNGTIQYGRPIWRQGAHTIGHNRGSIGICMIGGVNEHGDAEMNFTTEQLQSLYGLVKGLQVAYNIPDKNVKGHRDFSPDSNKNGIIEKSEWVKQCPCFDVQHWIETQEAIFEVL